MQRHRQQRREITPRAGVEVRATLQRVDELEEMLERKRSLTDRVRVPAFPAEGGREEKQKKLHTHIDEKGFTVQ